VVFCLHDFDRNTFIEFLFPHWCGSRPYRPLCFSIPIIFVKDSKLLVYRKTNLMHNLFLVYFVNLYMFLAYLGLSSGGTTVCIQQLVLVILCRWLSVDLQDNRQSSTVTTVVYIRLYLLMIGLDTPETCTGWRNLLRISYVSSWFLFTRLYLDAARSTKHKNSKLRCS